jgi:hypothetical protein
MDLGGETNVGSICSLHFTAQGGGLVSVRHPWAAFAGAPKRSSALTPASHYSAGNDRQNGPTGGGSYHLANEGADVEAP